MPASLLSMVALILAVTFTVTVRDAAASPGAVDPTFQASVAGGYVLVAAIQPDAKMVIAGSFNTVGGQPHAHIARLNADGTVDASFSAQTNGDVRGLALDPAGRILLVGGFTSVNGTPRNRIARIEADGTVEAVATFDPGTGANGEIYCVAVQADGKVLIGGDFTSVNGAARNRLARLLANGMVEGTATFNVGTGVNAYISTLAVQPDGKVLLGGGFTTVNGATRNRLARLNADGSIESTTTFALGTGANADVGVLVVQSDGKVLIGGGFTSINGATRNRLARLNGDGSIESTTTFNLGTGANDWVTDIALQADGKMLIAGYFSAINGTSRARIAQLKADGSLAPGTLFGALPVGVVNDAIYCVGLQSDGKVMIGGAFTAVGLASRSGLARLDNDGQASGGLNIPGADAVRWMRGATAPEVSDVIFNLSTDAGITWTSLGAGARIAGGWLITGLSLPANGIIGACGRTKLGRGGNGLVRSTLIYPDSANTQVPTLGAPVPLSANGRYLAILYTLPETPLSGSVRVNFTGPSVSEARLTTTIAGTSSISIDTSNLAATPLVSTVSGSNALADGTYTVTISYQDTLGNAAASASSNNVIIDRTPPVLTLPGTAVAEATGAGGAVVNFATSALDAKDPAPVLNVSRTSGSNFPIGTTLVSVTATDWSGNVATGSFEVIVRDTTAPVVTPPSNLTVHATNPTGALTSYPAATATDAVGVSSLTYSQNSGTIFPIGTTTVTLTATDAANNSGMATFTVTVIPLTSVESWRYAHFGTAQNSVIAADSANPDGDGIINVLEFAFGTDPMTSTSGPAALEYGGTFAVGGTIIRTGQPAMMSETREAGTELRALYVRRKDYAAAGLTYTLEFSSNLTTWEATTVTPSVLADDGQFQIVSAPYPSSVGADEAHFFRVKVRMIP